MRRRYRRARRSNPVDRTPFGLGIVGLLMVGTGLAMAWAWKNMNERDKQAYLPK